MKKNYAIFSERKNSVPCVVIGVSRYEHMVRFGEFNFCQVIIPAWYDLKTGKVYRIDNPNEEISAGTAVWSLTPGAAFIVDGKKVLLTKTFPEGKPVYITGPDAEKDYLVYLPVSEYGKIIGGMTKFGLPKSEKEMAAEAALQKVA